MWSERLHKFYWFILEFARWRQIDNSPACLTDRPPACCPPKSTLAIFKRAPATVCSAFVSAYVCVCVLLLPSPHSHSSNNFVFYNGGKNSQTLYTAKPIALSRARAHTHMHTGTHTHKHTCIPTEAMANRRSSYDNALLLLCHHPSVTLLTQLIFRWALCRVFELNARARAGGRLNVFIHSKFQRTSVCGRQPPLPLSSSAFIVNSPQLSFVAL